MKTKKRARSYADMGRIWCEDNPPHCILGPPRTHARIDPPGTLYVGGCIAAMFYREQKTVAVMLGCFMAGPTGPRYEKVTKIISAMNGCRKIYVQDSPFVEIALKKYGAHIPWDALHAEVIRPCRIVERVRALYDNIAPLIHVMSKDYYEHVLTRAHEDYYGRILTRLREEQERAWRRAKEYVAMWAEDNASDLEDPEALAEFAKRACIMWDLAMSRCADSRFSLETLFELSDNDAFKRLVLMLRTGAGKG